MMNSSSDFSRCRQALSNLLGPEGDQNWVLGQLAAGGQATLFLVSRPDARPVWQSHERLVLKVFHSTEEGVEAAVRDEYQALHQLYKLLHGADVQGWRIHCPQPLHLFEEPLAVLMTAVPGRPLSHFLRAGEQLPREKLAAVGRAVMAAMDRYWRLSGRIYGDINFHNILCDPRRKSLSLVDPGMAMRSWLCEGVGRKWYPASRDAAYMLYSVACAVKSTLGNRAARNREKWLVRLMLRTHLETIAPSARAGLLDEIHACARIHVAGINGSWSPAGVWRAIVRKAADRCISEILGSLREPPLARQRVLAFPGQEAVP